MVGQPGFHDRVGQGSWRREAPALVEGCCFSRSRLNKGSKEGGPMELDINEMSQDDLPAAFDT
jgi:hypothetical protein